MAERTHDKIFPYGTEYQMVDLVRNLIATQFPQWKDLPVTPVANGGWDNRTFHLSDTMLVRLPSAACYALKVEKEHQWLPILAPLLPVAIPEPLALGQPNDEYPFQWSIYRWIEGETAASALITDKRQFAVDLAQFLVALHRIDATGGPLAGTHNFYRGGSLMYYDEQTRQAIELLKDKIDADAATAMWQTTLATHWNNQPVWVHGDIAPGNLLVRNGKLSAVIDFGGLAIGDPACDLAIAWTFFTGDDRKIFRATLGLDEGTWARGRAWALWKALILAAGMVQTNAVEAQQTWRTLDEIFDDYKSEFKLSECYTNTEWEIAKHFRQHYFFNKVGLKDPYVWTFDHKDHKHFVLYHNKAIIGYAHIQLWPNGRAAIRIIVINESQRNKGYGSLFLSLCEQYLKKRGYKSIHAEANPASLIFYKKNGYREMPFNDPENYPTDELDTAVGKIL